MQCEAARHSSQCLLTISLYIHPNSLGQSDPHQTIYISDFQFATALMAVVRAVI